MLDQGPADVSLRICFCVGRAPAVKEVLPARKSLRLQKKEAEVLTLPPEPRDTQSHEKVADSDIFFGCFFWFIVVVFVMVSSHFVCFKVFYAKKALWAPAYKPHQHGGGKQAAFTTSGHLL